MNLTDECAATPAHETQAQTAGGARQSLGELLLVGLAYID
jgi:hypothetical protein